MFVINDGDSEYVEMNFSNEEEAIGAGRRLLQAKVEVRDFLLTHTRTAVCAVKIGSRSDSAADQVPLGKWEWHRDRREWLWRSN